MKKSKSPKTQIYKQQTSQSDDHPKEWMYPCPTPFIPPSLEEAQEANAGAAEPSDCLAELSYIPETHYEGRDTAARTKDYTGWSYTYE
ncbi:hypothetical protein B566_EDAN007274 [Ephemera danica]|nr:hypothetical protein B566_EDAN007274 [Ephemera danica]